MFIWILAGIFLILSLLLLSGHGAWLIAGYNTASEEEKKQFDEKKLCKTMGVMLLITTAAIILLKLELINVAVYVGLLFTAVIFTMIYANKCCKRK